MALGWYVLLGLLLPGAVLSAYYPHEFLRTLEKTERDMLSGLQAVRSHLDKNASGKVVVLNTSGIFLTFYPGEIYQLQLGQPVPTYVLSSLHGKVTLERTGPQSFVLRTDRPGWLTNPLARAVRHDPRLKPGTRYGRGVFHAILVQLTADGKDALAVQFDFHVPLNDPSLLFLAWDGERLSALDIASLPTGRPMPLADTSNVWKSMK